MIRPLKIILFGLALASPAQAEVWRLRSPSAVVTDGGSSLRLPPGRFVDETGWSDLDKEMRRLQEAEVRLRAERDAHAAQPKAPPAVVLAALVLGVVIGGGAVWYAGR